MLQTTQEKLCILSDVCNDIGGCLMKSQKMETWIIIGILLTVSGLMLPSFVSSSTNEIQFSSDRELTSEAIELGFSTYLGGSDSDEIYAIAIDDNDDIYLAGWTESSDFPTTEGVYDRSHNGGVSWASSDCFVMKLSNDGQEIIYSTFIGGSNHGEYVTGIAVDEERNVYITGRTSSDDFPTTQYAYDRTYNGGEADCFVAKLSSDGSELLFSTYIGGSEYENPYGIAIGESGECYVVGNTYSPDFPVDTPNEQESCHTLGGDQDGFVIKLCDNGTRLDYSMYLGGNGVRDDIFDLTIDSGGNIVLVGFTWSSDFPIVNAYDDELSGDTEGIIAKVHSNGSFIFSTFFGGSDVDSIYSVDINHDDIYLAGSTGGDFPIIGVDNPPLNGSFGIFLSILSEQGTVLEYSGIIKNSKQGGVSTRVGSLIVVSEHEIWLGGNTGNENFPVTADALDKTMLKQDGFLTMIDPISCTLNYSTFFGGSEGDFTSGLVIDSSRHIISCGSTESNDIPVKNALESEKISPEHYYNGFVFSLILPSNATHPELLPTLPLIAAGIGIISLIVIVVVAKKLR